MQTIYDSSAGGPSAVDGTGGGCHGRYSRVGGDTHRIGTAVEYTERKVKLIDWFDERKNDTGSGWYHKLDGSPIEEVDVRFGREVTACDSLP